jgi:RNA polymerase sigma factor (TIGR02999 family)
VSDDAQQPANDPARASELTRLLHAAREGQPQALNDAFAIVYAELKRMARRTLGGESATLNATGLVHECYLRIAGSSARPGDRGHFFALAARVMRQVICDHARKRLAQKRDGGAAVSLGAADVALLDEAQRLVELDEILGLLAEHHPRQADVVVCRSFAGLTAEETAEALGISARTVQSDWAEARLWLADRAN